VAQAL
jgi:hypothetical protein